MTYARSWVSIKRIESVPTPFLARGQFVGYLRLSCPWCGFVSEHRIRPSTFKVQCRNYQCRKSLGYGLQLWEVPVGRAGCALPRDFIIPNAPDAVTEETPIPVAIDPMPELPVLRTKHKAARLAHSVVAIFEEPAIE